MKKLLLILICSPIIGFAQQTISGTMLHDNLQRQYILYTPASYDANTPVPLVFCFHGYGSANINIKYYSNFTSIADTAGFIIVFPQGRQDTSGKTHWNVGFGGSVVNDLGFVEILLDTISNQYNIDLTRVYSTGMSNGGYLSILLACQ